MSDSGNSTIGSRPSRRDFLRVSTMAAVTGGVAAGRPAPAAIKSPVKPAWDFSRGCPAEIRAALSGPWPSIHTPFSHNGDIDYTALRRQLDFLIEEAKVKAVVLTWGDSLFSILTDDEIAQVTKAVCRHVKKRAFVVAAGNRWWTGKAVEFAKYCTDAGADMLMVLPPDWAASTTLDSLVAHYRAVANVIPVMLVTNYLSARGADFAVELTERLLKEVPGVTAVKDDVGGALIRRMLVLARDRWAVCAGGQKKHHLQIAPLGAVGYLSTFINFRPDIAWRYWKAVEAGDWAKARQVVDQYDVPLFDFIIKSEGSFDAAMHGILELFGRAKRFRRMPYHSLTDRQMDDLAAFLKGKAIL